MIGKFREDNPAGRSSVYLFMRKKRRYGAGFLFYYDQYTDEPSPAGAALRRLVLNAVEVTAACAVMSGLIMLSTLL